MHLCDMQSICIDHNSLILLSYVMCLAFNVTPAFPGYLAPDKIDSKFFDPKFAFKEVEVQAKSVSELVFQKKKPKVRGEETWRELVGFVMVTS